MHAVISDVAVRRTWAARDLFETDNQRPVPVRVEPSLRGSAVLEVDSVAVLGVDGRETKRFTAVIAPFDDWHSLEAGWKQHTKDWGEPIAGWRGDPPPPISGELLGQIRRSLARLQQKPPTLHIGFVKADWESGTGDTWLLSCDVPRKVVDELVSRVEAGESPRVEMAFTMVPSLSNDHYAPPSVPITLVIPRLGQYDDGTAYGWIESFSWGASGDPRARESDVLNMEDAMTESATSVVPGPVQPAADLNRNVSLIAESLVRLSRTVKLGFILLLVLIGLLALIR